MNITLSKLSALFIGLALGFMIGLTIPTTKKEVIVQLNPDLSNLNTQVAVLQGQVSAITGRYNDYGDRLRIIEDRMKIFNRGD
jgi:hypothetical protein